MTADAWLRASSILTRDSVSDLQWAVFDSEHFGTAEAYLGREETVVEASINVARIQVRFPTRRHVSIFLICDCHFPFQLAKSALTSDYADTLAPSCQRDT